VVIDKLLTGSDFPLPLEGLKTKKCGLKAQGIRERNKQKIYIPLNVVVQSLPSTT
jgi:hypothetical protein